MAEASFHEVVWTEALLSELAEKLEENGVRSRSSIDRICDGIRTTFPQGEITHEAYAQLAQGRHHLHGGATGGADHGRAGSAATGHLGDE